jgi:hypothetical protein
MTEVAKADGTLEAFKPAKLLQSLRRAGASDADAARIAQEIEGQLYRGITTQEIYSHAFARLRRLPAEAGRHRGAAARYSLKRAVLQFGPSGFPFESYIAELLRVEGYTAQTDQIVKGSCVEHEVDVVAHKDGKTVYVEAKFHNSLGLRSDLKTALYVEARMEDLKRARPGEEAAMSGLLVTNTKFSEQAIAYAQCRSLALLSWDYPHGETLHERIDRAGLYPVTALTTLSKHEKTALLSQRFVLCTALPKQPEVLTQVGVSGKKAGLVLEEVGALCIPGRDI